MARVAADRQRLLEGGECAGRIARPELDVGDPVEIDRHVLLRARIVLVGLGALAVERERLLVGGKRRLAVALRALHVADADEADREIADRVLVGSAGLGEAAQDRVALLGVLLRRGEIAGREIGLGELVQHHRLAAQQRRIAGIAFGQPLDGLARLVEDLVEALDPDAFDIAQALRDLEDQAIDRALGRGEIALGAIGLDLGDDPGRHRADRKHEQERRGRHGQRQRAPLLAHLLRQQILLRHAVDGGGEIGAEIDESGASRGSAPSR